MFRFLFRQIKTEIQYAYKLSNYFFGMQYIVTLFRLKRQEIFNREAIKNNFFQFFEVF